jgi:hypothetical protein
VFLVLAGTVAASLSNLISQRNQRHGIPVVQGNAVSMTYGAALVALCLAGNILVLPRAPRVAEGAA